ncbi:DNA primase/helicase [Sphingomonas phage Kharn]|uniref:DNA primase/helicase n=1 Tax=Sphingomonas phage Kharn TaxID=2686312 RepID=A0A6M3TCJ1_9CAUD|nr:DNA primase/helicase [Sphingomonas phage Kharn]QJD54535.1 DNA primase/helicase [Sphingomonas phage Kharn]
MKAFDQWVVWRYENKDGAKPTKVPYCPRWATKAAVDNPKTWGSFTDALQAMASGEVDGVGFVLTEDDPYGFIDLDNAWQRNENGAFIHEDPQGVHDRQVKIFNTFDSYAEKSPSGEGLHIIVKTPGVPNGRKRSSIEVYTSKRFMTMTGDVFHDAAIAERGEIFDVLWKELGGPAQKFNVMGDVEQRQTDDEVLNAATAAANGAKFLDLWQGDWQKHYPGQSQSEADFALVDILAFYTQNRAQITRLFRASALGVRDKAKRDDYINYMVNKSFDRQLPPLDIEGLLLHLRERIEAANGGGEGPPPPALDSAPIAAPGMVADTLNANGTMPAPPPAVNGSIAVPPGLVGEIAQFIYDTAPRPVMEIALAGALAFVSGVAGRAYNVSGTGLNHYIMLIAPTGTGKEAIGSGINRLAEQIAWGPDGAQFTYMRQYIGPSQIASGAGLLKWFERSKCFISVLGEIGITLKRITHPNANSHEKQIMQVMLDLYNKSGAGDLLNPTAYSDKDKVGEPIASPAFTMIGESVPEKFYEALDETMVSSGLLPRFTIIEYTGPRPKMNATGHNTGASPALLANCRAFLAKCHALNSAQNFKPMNVSFSREAHQLFNQFNEYADTQINGNQAEVVKQLWNRAHLKAMKLAAVVATGIYWNSPVIDYNAAKWACDFVAHDIARMLDKFERGDIGISTTGFNDKACHNDVIQFINKLVTMDTSEAERKYKVPPTLHAMGIIPWKALAMGVSQRASFRNSRMGSTNALKAAVQFMIDSGELRELGSKDKDKFGTTQRCFAINDVSIIG